MVHHPYGSKIWSNLFLITKKAGKTGLFVYVRLRLIFHDFGNDSHGAFFHALAASDAGILIGHLGDAAQNLQNLLRTSVYADTATDALVGVNNWMSH